MKIIVAYNSANTILLIDYVQILHGMIPVISLLMLSTTVVLHSIK